MRSAPTRPTRLRLGAAAMKKPAASGRNCKCPDLNRLSSSAATARAKMPESAITTACGSRAKAVFLDPRGEAGAICGPYRRTLGPYYNVNSFGVLTDIPGYEDLESDGLNCWRVGSQPPDLFDDAAGFAEALDTSSKPKTRIGRCRRAAWSTGLTMCGSDRGRRPTGRAA